MPSGEFALVEVKNEILEELPEPVPDEVAEASPSASLGWKAVLVDEFADVQEKAINPIVAMKLDPPEMFTAKFDGLDRSEPPEQVIYIRSSVRVQFMGSTETHKRGLENAIR